MKIAIVGSGISGLSFAHLAMSDHEVIIYEKNSSEGGLARIKKIDDVPYHLVGGHCFNSKSQRVLDFVFNIMPIDNWNKVQRKANIYMDNFFLDYPIEFSLKHLHQIKPELARKAIVDFLAAPGASQEDLNLELWFRNTFGNTLAELYFLPYNKKIWGVDPINMSATWVKDKLPIPNKFDFVDSLLCEAVDNMVHSSFYYPKNIDDNLVNRLAKNKVIKLDSPVKSIKKLSEGFLINDAYRFDEVVYTAPLDELADILQDVPDRIKIKIKNLKFNKITNVIWETSGVDATWTYLPEAQTIFHRHIHIGNFMSPAKNYTITEALGENSYDLMIEEGKKFPFLIKPVGYNVSKHAYVVYDDKRTESLNEIKKFCAEIGINLLGRFGEWEYYNMDVCIESAIKLIEKFRSKKILIVR